MLRANDVLVRVKACALNHLDLCVRRGLPNVPIPLPHIPGSDVAGEIARIGADVTAIRVGQKVVLAPLVSCGKCTACLAGLDNHCRQASNLGYMIDGGSAEFVRAPEVNCLAYPENLKWEEAAAIPLVFQTAWHMLVTRGELQAGEDVSSLVQAAAWAAPPFKSRSSLVPASSPLLVPRKSSPKQENSVPTTSSITKHRKFATRCAASPTNVAWTWCLSTSARPAGKTASRASRPPAVSSPAARPPAMTPRWTCVFFSAASCRCSGPT